MEQCIQASPFLAAKGPVNALQEIPIEQIQVNPFQPRQDFDSAALHELSQSIQQHGIIQPLTVKKLRDGTYEYQLITGERRLQASRLAGLTHVPAYIRTADDQQMLEMALVENIQRENLNPIEIALSYQRLLTECKIKQDALGIQVGKDRTTVNNYLRLLKLPPDVQIALRSREISMGHARALINIASTDTQLRLLQEILKHGLSVRDVEARARLLTQGKSTVKQPAKAQKNVTFQALGTQLGNRLRTSVKIQPNPDKGGAIKITFVDTQDLERIIKLLDTSH
ncbi:MAG: ParB/RepB/Spo0J family partition protein [Bacteroidota bacterium]